MEEEKARPVGDAVNGGEDEEVELDAENNEGGTMIKNEDDKELDDQKRIQLNAAMEGGKARPVSDAVNGEEEVELDTENNEDDTLITNEDDKELDDQERIQLYEKGIKFKLNHSYQHALLCFLGCIKGLKQTTTFPFLPNCLQNIASIYATFEDFPKAVQFMQAAKLYYETALIGSKETKGDDGYQTMDENATEEDAKKANEYERLSHDCLKEKNINLALEYCGKSTQLRRKVYGENHAVTIRSLDLFTMIYAEMGKLQYSEAIGTFEKKVTFEEDASKENEDNEDKSEYQLQEMNEEKPTEIKTDDEDQIINAVENEKEKVLDNYEISSNFLSFKQIIIVIVLSIIAALLITWVWCKFTGNKICPSYNYMSERVKYYYYFYIKSWLNKNKYL